MPESRYDKWLSLGYPSFGSQREYRDYIENCEEIECVLGRRVIEDRKRNIKTVEYRESISSLWEAKKRKKR